MAHGKKNILYGYRHTQIIRKGKTMGKFSLVSEEERQECELMIKDVLAKGDLTEEDRRLIDKMRFCDITVVGKTEILSMHKRVMEEHEKIMEGIGKCQDTSEKIDSISQADESSS